MKQIKLVKMEERISLDALLLCTVLGTEAMQPASWLQ
jgi:hypothetical protein